MVSSTGRDAPRILVPLDESTLAEQALPFASAVGGAAASLTLLMVASEASAQRLLVAGLAASADEAHRRYDDACRERLTRAARAWLGEGRDVQIEVRTGNPAEEILRTVDELEIDLIVMASHGRGALGRWTFGSVTDRVVRASQVPVMVVRPHDAPIEIGVRPIIRRVVVPLDGSALAEQALPEAARLAKRLTLPIHLVRVLEPAESVVAVPFETPFPDGFFEEMHQAALLDAERSLRTASEPLRAAGLSVSEEVLTGAVATTLIDATEQGDIVVLTSHGLTGLRRWLLGSVAEKLIRYGKVPTIVVPASGRAAIDALG